MGYLEQRVWVSAFHNTSSQKIIFVFFILEGIYHQNQFVP